MEYLTWFLIFSFVLFLQSHVCTGLLHLLIFSYLDHYFSHVSACLSLNQCMYVTSFPSLIFIKCLCYSILYFEVFFDLIIIGLCVFHLYIFRLFIGIKSRNTVGNGVMHFFSLNVVFLLLATEITLSSHSCQVLVHLSVLKIAISKKYVL